MKKKRHYQENNRSPEPALNDGTSVRGSVLNGHSHHDRTNSHNSPGVLPIRPTYLTAMVNGIDVVVPSSSRTANHPQSDDSSEKEVFFKNGNGHAEPPPKKRIITRSLAEDASKLEKVVPEPDLPPILSSTSVRHSKRLDPDSKFAIDTTAISAAAQISFDEDMLKLMTIREKEYMPQKNYLTWHPALAHRSRCKALEWLTQVAECEQMTRETYHKAVNYFDRYMSNIPNVPVRQVQLICLSALSVAAKVEEHSAHLSFKRIVHITANEFTTEQALKMEQVLMETIKWNLLPPTVVSWYNLYTRRLAKRIPGNYNIEKDHELYLQAMRLLDVCTLDYFSLQFPPSLQAFCALSLLSPETVEYLRALRPNPDPLQEACFEWMKFLFRSADIQRIVQMKAKKAHVEPGHHLLQESYPDAYPIMSMKMRVAREQLRAKASEKPPIPESQRSKK